MTLSSGLTMKAAGALSTKSNIVNMLNKATLRDCLSLVNVFLAGEYKVNIYSNKDG